MEKSTFKLNLPADGTLTSDNFKLNGDGSVTVKNKELSDFLGKKLTDSVTDKSVTQQYIGVVWG